MIKHYALLFVAVLPLAAATAQVTDSTVALPPITVTAARMPVEITNAPVRTQLLNQHELEVSAAPTVAALLGLRTTLYVRSYGDGLSTLSQRGSTASQVLVLLDGTPIASPQAGQLDLSLLPLSLINSIEVTSGAGSALYGANAAGGVINLLTSSDAPDLTLRAGTGSWGRRKASVQAAGKRGSFSGMFAADILRSTGDFSYWNNALSPQRYASREGADQNRQSILGSLLWERPSTEIQVSGLYNNAERGIPTIHATAIDSARQWDKHGRLWTQATQKREWGSLQVNAQVESGELRYTNPRWGIDDTGRHFDTGSELALNLNNVSGWRLNTGLTGGYTHVRHPSLESNSHEYRFALYLSGARTWKSLTVYPSIRLDSYPREQIIWALAPRLGMNMALNSSSTLRLKSSAGRAFRMPTFNDRFWQPGGNLDLRPEKGWSYDAGIAWTLRTVQAEFTAFVLHMKDQIVWRPGATGVWSPANVLEVTNRGMEMSLRLQQKFHDNFQVDGGALWTFTDSRDTESLRLVPRHQIKTYSDMQWRFLALQIGARYHGTQFVAEDAKMDRIFLMDAHVRLHFDPITVRFILENALDARYEYVTNNPMAPRSIRLDLSFSIH